jgi:phenylpyruvate tautomerase PptA (4-oxalocrotonate tautomerase family)
MPILTVRIVGAERDIPAQRIADAAAETLKTGPQETWVILQRVDDYAENGGADARPVFVSVLKRRIPAGDELQREVDALTRAVAQACGRPPENVHILYEPAGSGRVFFGGRGVS